MKDGFKFMKDKEYFAIDAVSNSFLINFDKSPAHALLEIQQTPSMKKGSLIHSIILDNEFDEKYQICYAKNKKCNEYKEVKAFHPNQEIILHTELEEIEKIKANILEYEMMSDLKFDSIFNDSDAKKEICGFYYDPEFELLMKGKFDIFYNNKNIPMIFDLKKTTNAFNFEKSIFNYKYYRQAAFYNYIVEKLTGVKPLFFFIALEDVEPYGIQFYQLDDDLIKSGWDEIKVSMQKYKAWKEAGSIIKAFRDGFEIVQKPGWFDKKYK
jgi:hypothetical protein